jgi:hypothetical protein
MRDCVFIHVRMVGEISPGELWKGKKMQSYVLWIFCAFRLLFYTNPFLPSFQDPTCPRLYPNLYALPQSKIHSNHYRPHDLLQTKAPTTMAQPCPPSTDLLLLHDSKISCTSQIPSRSHSVSWGSESWCRAK